MSADWEPLFRAILEDPFDLVLRRIAVDALQECDDEDSLARAEFIRAQIDEEAPHPRGLKLLEGKAGDWLGVPGWKVMPQSDKSTVSFDTSHGQLITHHAYLGQRISVFHFGERPYLEVRWCWGFAGWLLMQRFRDLLDIGEAVFRQHPVVGVVCHQLRPRRTQDDLGPDLWRFLRDERVGHDFPDGIGMLGHLPADLFDCMSLVHRRGMAGLLNGEPALYFTSATNAGYALERAIVDWSRSRVGLGPLPELDVLRDRWGSDCNDRPVGQTGD